MSPDARTTTSSAVAFTRVFWGFARGRGVALAGGAALQAGLEAGALVLLLPLLQAVGLGGPPAVSARWMPATLSGMPGPTRLAVVLVVFLVVKSLQAILRGSLEVRTAGIELDFLRWLRDRLHAAMLGAQWVALRRHRASDLSHALLQDLPVAASGGPQLIAVSTVALVTAVQLGVAVILAPLTTLLGIVAGAALTVGLRSIRQRALALRARSRAENAELAAVVAEQIAGLKVTKAHGAEAANATDFGAAQMAAERPTRAAQRAQASGRLAGDVGLLAALGAFVFFAAALQHLDAPRIVVLVFILNRLLVQIAALESAWSQLLRALPAFAATESLHQELCADAEDLRPLAAPSMRLQSAVRLENVTFGYDEATAAPPVLHGVSLELRAGEVTALCGPSGAGKTTVADLVLGLLQPNQGRVLVDSEPLTGERLAAWRASLGYVPQDPFLHHATIRDNLRRARRDATEPEMWSALSMAAAHRFVEALPSGLDTVVGDRGLRLSGGERQRIALAGALIRRPALLVLDEATSALDAENERAVQDAIERIRAHTTILLIAHRFTTVRAANAIWVLQAGRVAEHGQWDTLMQRQDGVLRRLAAGHPADHA